MESCGGGYSPGDVIVKWEPWEKKFALLPKETKNGRVWFKSYYQRKGRSRLRSFIERGTFFDVIKSDE